MSPEARYDRHTSNVTSPSRTLSLMPMSLLKTIARCPPSTLNRLCVAPYIAAPPKRTVLASLPAAPPPCGIFIFLPRFCMAEDRSAPRGGVFVSGCCYLCSQFAKQDSLVGSAYIAACMACCQVSSGACHATDPLFCNVLQFQPSKGAYISWTIAASPGSVDQAGILWSVAGMVFICTLVW